MGLRSCDPIEVPSLPMPGVPNLTGVFHAGIFHHRPAYLWYRNATETPYSKYTYTTKNTVVTSPPACWLVGQQCDTRRYFSVPRWYVTPTLACRTAPVSFGFFLICLEWLLTLRPNDIVDARWDPCPRLLRRSPPLVAPLLTSKIVNSSQSLSQKKDPPKE